MAYSKAHCKGDLCWTVLPSYTEPSRTSAIGPEAALTPPIAASLIEYRKADRAQQIPDNASETAFHSP
jgi:hypothetical protein